MATTTRFIDQSDLDTYYAFSVNIADIEINPSILNAQDKYVLPILTTTIYENLQTAVEDSTETADDTALINKLKPFLVFKSLQEFVSVSGQRSTEVGFRKLKEQFSEIASPEDLEVLANKFHTEAIPHGRKLRNFLKVNYVTYSWEACEASKESILPRLSFVQKPKVYRR